MGRLVGEGREGGCGGILLGVGRDLKIGQVVGEGRDRNIVHKILNELIKVSLK